MHGAIKTTCGIGGKYRADLIPHPTENRQLLILAACGMSRIIKWEMVPVDLAGKYRTGLVGIAANGDDCFHTFI